MIRPWNKLPKFTQELAQSLSYYHTWNSLSDSSLEGYHRAVAKDYQNEVQCGRNSRTNRSYMEASFYAIQIRYGTFKGDANESI